MSDWQEIDLEVISDGLDANPTQLHAVFEIAGDHLKEVRDRHTMMLVTAGELPENHMAEIAPERRLSWMVEELNGRKEKDGLVIPLHGADATMIELAKGEVDGHSILRLKVGHDFERNLPLPAKVDAIEAKLEGGVLNLRW